MPSGAATLQLQGCRTGSWSPSRNVLLRLSGGENGNVGLPQLVPRWPSILAQIASKELLVRNFYELLTIWVTRHSRYHYTIPTTQIANDDHFIFMRLHI